VRYWIAALFVTLLAPTASAQMDSAATWPIGSRVRVWTAPGRNVAGELTEVRGDTLIVTKTGISSHSWTLHVDSARRIEVSRGRYVSADRIVAGALLGAASVLAFVSLFDAAIPDLCPWEQCAESGPTNAQLTMMGAAAGAVAGAMRLADRWEEVSKPVRVSIVPQHREARVAIAVIWRL
jgi:hypothetical protein